MKSDQKESSPFFKKKDKDPDLNKYAHFFITQIQTLFLAIFITGMMQFSNHLAIYLVYCCPMYFFIVVIQYFIFWRPQADFTSWFNLYNVAMLLICLPIFFGVFFAVFHPTASLNFRQVQNCQMIGQLSNFIENTEKYSILYINFEYEGQSYLGQACASNFYEQKTSSPILPYKFYYKFDEIECGPSDGNRTDPQYNRLLLYQNQTDKNDKQRILRTVGNDHYNSGAGSCYTDYLWSKVKIASWLCQNRKFNIEQYMKPHQCYVNFYKGQNAYSSGLQREQMKNQPDFPLIAYKEHAYFPEADLVCLILFSYYNWILSLNSIFQYTSNIFLNKIKQSKQSKQINIQPSKQKKNENQQIQLEQANKNQQNYIQNQNQIQFKHDLSNQSDCIVQPITPDYFFQQSLDQSSELNQVPIYTKNGKINKSKTFKN